MSSKDTPARADEQTSTAPEDALRQERDDTYNRLLRVTAEFDNYRKRVERERRDLAETAGADVIRDLLPVIDNLERALEVPTPDPAVATYRSGVELIHRGLLEVIRRRGVEPLEVVGQDFDPEWHEAVANEPLDGHRDGEVTAEVRRGYRIGGRLLRPAMVKVAKA